MVPDKLHVQVSNIGELPVTIAAVFLRAPIRSEHRLYQIACAVFPKRLEVAEGESVFVNAERLRNAGVRRDAFFVIDSLGRWHYVPPACS